MSRRSHRKRRDANQINQLPWQLLHNPFPPMEPLSPDQVESIIDAALNILERQGLSIFARRKRADTQ